MKHGNSDPLCINVNSLRLLGAHESAVSPAMQCLHVAWIFPEFTFLFCIRFVHAETTRDRQQNVSFSSSSISVHSGRPFRHSHIFFRVKRKSKTAAKKTPKTTVKHSLEIILPNRCTFNSQSGAGSDCVWCFFFRNMMATIRDFTFRRHNTCSTCCCKFLVSSSSSASFFHRL